MTISVLFLRSQRIKESPDFRRAYFTTFCGEVTVVTDLINMNVADEVVFAHAYTHTLQDEYLDLDSCLLGATSTDANMATRALVEGGATVVLAVYAYGNTTDSQWDYLARQASYAEDLTLGTERMSERVSDVVTFPYLEGLMFVMDLWRRAAGRSWVRRSPTRR